MNKFKLIDRKINFCTLKDCSDIESEGCTLAIIESAFVKPN